MQGSCPPQATFYTHKWFLQHARFLPSPSYFLHTQMVFTACKVPALPKLLSTHTNGFYSMQGSCPPQATFYTHKWFLQHERFLPSPSYFLHTQMVFTACKVPALPKLLSTHTNGFYSMQGSCPPQATFYTQMVFTACKVPALPKLLSTHTNGFYSMQGSCPPQASFYTHKCGIGYSTCIKIVATVSNDMRIRGVQPNS